VQAPKQRSAPRTPGDRRTVVYLAGFAAAGILLLGGVLALLAFGGGGDDGGAKSGISSKYCVEESHRGLPPRHLTNPDAKVNYNSFPPSSGPHYQEWAPWGWYDDSIRQTILVHNLEHGGVVIQYGPGVSKDDVRELQSFFNDDPNGLVVAPYARLEKRFVLTAWNAPPYDRGQEDVEDVDAGKGHVMTCTRFDEDAFGEFRDKRRGKGGERIPVHDLVPGTQ
jgi:hypothetical protein